METVNKDFVIEKGVLKKYRGNNNIVVIPGEVKIIGQEAFRKCIHIIDVTIPDGVIEICEAVFSDKPNCTPVVGKDAFKKVHPSVNAALKAAARKEYKIPGAWIVTVTNLRRHENADRLFCTDILGYHVITNINCRPGQRMVFFPAGTLLDKEFAEEIRSLTGGFLHRNRLKIRPEKIRGMVSEGLLLPIEVLCRYTDIEELHNGDGFSNLNGREICSVPIPNRMDIDPINNTLLKYYEGDSCPKTVFIPYGIRKIGRSAFICCKKPERVIIPQTVENIGDYAFYKCTSLRNVVIPGSVDHIGCAAFAECSGLTAVKILDGVKSSRFYQALGQAQRSAEEQYSDSWDRYFNRVKLLKENGMDITGDCHRMCDIMMTRDDKMRQMVKKHFTPQDYFAVRDHMVGTGMIGGKACGMLLARAIIRNKESDISEVLEPHDSFYVGSDLYYTYIVDNNLWDTRIKQRTEDGYFELAQEFADKIMGGTFSDAMRDQFVRIIEYYGQDPYIIRSSSILEDGFGNAFAGKYESVFCVNRGSLEERLEEFEHAIKVVYASSMSLSALDYRKRRGLDKRDEQMALLIQRVSGSYYGSNYMPCAAGVGYSYSPYRIMKESDPTAGMLRLVMGLGTSAVDRTEGSYPRIVNLDMPQKTPYSSSTDKHKFSQGKAEVINMTDQTLKKLPLEDIAPDIPNYLGRILFEHDYDAESRLREMGRRRDVRFISCKGLVANSTLMEQMKRMLHCIQEEYEYPVDIEFTINISENGEYSIDLLQCRPLQVQKGQSGTVIPPDVPEGHILLETKGSSMGMCKATDIDIVVYVDPVKYYNMPYKEKDLVAKLVGKINGRYGDMGKHMMLIVPGRVGTTSPELGVPTAFFDISAYEIICEIEESKAGYNPELSYGSHIFQDLVESEILYTAVFNSEKTVHFSPEKLESSKDLVSEFEQSETLSDIVHIYANI